MRIRVRNLCVSVAVLAAMGSIAGAAPARSEGLSPHDVARLRAVGGIAISPDGERVAYLLSVPRVPGKDEDGRAWSELWVADAEGEVRPFVTGEVNAGSITWTADGEIAFLAKREGDEETALYTIPADGGEARRRVSHETAIKEYAFRPDGEAVAFLAEAKKDEGREEQAEKGFDREIFEEEWKPTEVWVHSIGDDDAEPRRLDFQGSASALSWSPAGNRLAVALAPTSLIDDHYMKRRVHVVDVESGEVLSEIDHAAKLGAVAWSADGEKLAMVTGEDVNDPSPGRLLVAEAASGEYEWVIGIDWAGHVSSIAWGADGDLFFLGDEGVETTIYRLEDGAGEPAPLGEPSSVIWTSLAVARDAEVLALLGESPNHPGEVFRLVPGEGAAERLTDSNPWLAERELGRQEVVHFAARDGLELEGILVHPVARDGDERVPLVMIVHGGPESHHRNGWVTTYARASQIFSGIGFASFYTNYRGSTGRGVEFSKLSQADPAGKEFDDLVDAVDHLIEIGLVDKTKVGITGASYGGYATAWASTYYSERFAAGVMFVGISNEISKFGTSDIPNELMLVHQRHWPWEDWQLMLERSPIYHVEKARTPLLILHGKDDTRVFRGQSLELYRFLKVLGQTPVRLVLYPGEGHGNRDAAARLDYTLRLTRWMEHYLVGEGGDPPPIDVDYEDPAAMDEESPEKAGEAEAPEKTGEMGFSEKAGESE